MQWDTYQPRLQFLDALRGLAAIYVAIYHLKLVGRIPVSGAIGNLADYGWTGVMLFFVVSCFSLFFTMAARKAEHYTKLAFYLRRLFRIAPLFYFWLLITSLHTKLKYGYLPSRADILSNVTFTFNLIPDKQQGIVMASWTIGVEMLFYVIFPLIYSKVKSISLAITFFVLSFFAYECLCVLTHYFIDDLSVASSTRLWIFAKDVPVFALGAVCYFGLRKIEEKGMNRKQSALVSGVFAIAGFLMFALVLSGTITDGVFLGHPFIWPGTIYSCALIALSLKPYTIVVNFVWEFIGKISYSVYLSHVPVISALSPVYAKILRTSPSETIGFLVCAVATFAAVIPLSYLTYRSIELPSIQIGKMAYRAIANFLKRRRAISSTDLN